MAESIEMASLPNIEEFVKALLVSPSQTQDLDTLKRDINNHFLSYWSLQVPAFFRPKDAKIVNTPLPNDYAYKELFEPMEIFITQQAQPGEAAKLLARIRGVRPPSQLCGKVFKCGEPNYSCRDCGQDGTCVMCVDCFKNSEHKNHRYKIGSSGSGCCDCGDPEAWKDNFACKLHAASDDQERFTARLHEIISESEYQQLLDRTRILIEMLLDYVYIMLKWDNKNLPDALVPSGNAPDYGLYASVLYNDETHTYEHVIHELVKAIKCDQKKATDYANSVDREGRAIIHVGCEESAVKIAKEISELSRKSVDKMLEVKVMCTYLLAHQNFSQRLFNWIGEICQIGESFRNIFAEHLLRKNHESSIISFVEPASFENSVSLLEKIMLSDVKFWKSIRLGWHKLFMSGLLMDLKHKSAFAIVYTRNIAKMFDDYIHDDHELKVSILSLAVQIFTVPSIDMVLLEKENVFQIMIDTFLDLNSRYHKTGMFKFESLYQMQTFRRSFQILYDLFYVLSQKPEPNRWNQALRDSFSRGVQSLCKLFKRMQLMDSVTRQVHQHIEYEPGWETGINFQMKVAVLSKAVIEWVSLDKEVFLSCLNISLGILKRNYEFVNRDVEQFFKRSVLVNNYDVSTKEVSIHFPLTRLVAGMLAYLSRFNIDYNDDSKILPSNRMAPESLIEYPLRTMALVAQFRAGMWRRNGYSLVNQVLFYFNVRLRDEMWDRDVQMLQIGAALMDSNAFLIHVLNKFNLLSLIDDVNPLQPSTSDDASRQTTTLIEELLRLIYIILMERYVPYLGCVTQDECIRHETIQWLCKGSLSNSELVNHTLAEFDKRIDDIVNSVADFKKLPESHGRYHLKDQFRCEFNPYFYHYSRQEQSTALETQLKAAKAAKDKFQCCPPPACPDFMPQFSNINQLLVCDVMMELIKAILKSTVDLKNTLFNDSHFQHVLSLIGVGLNEEKKNRQKFPFTTKCIDNGIVELLETCQSKHILPRVEMHKELLGWVFDKFKESMEWNRQDKTGESLQSLGSSKEESSSKDEETEKQRRRQLAQERKNRILAKIASQQQTFMEDNAQFFESSSSTAQSGSMMDISSIGQDGTSSPQISHEPVAVGVNQTRLSSTKPEKHTCILCLEDGINDGHEQFLVIGAYVQRSSVLSKQRDPKGSLSLYKQADPSFVPSTHKFGAHISTCTHYMHYDCYRKFHDTLVAGERNRYARNNSRTVGVDLQRSEFLCPLCECLCNAVIPLMPTVNYSQAPAERCDMPMDVMLSGLHSILQDANQIWVDNHDQLYLLAGFFKTFSQFAEVLPTSIRTYFENIKREYSDNEQPSLEERAQTAGCDPVSLNFYSSTKVLQSTALSFHESVLKRTLGTPPFHTSSKDSFWPASTEIWSVAYTIHTLERLIRTNRYSFAELTDSRPDHCLRHLTSLLRSLYLFEKNHQGRLIFMRQMNYLLVKNVYNSSPYTILDLDAFTLLVSLLSSSGSIFNDTNTVDGLKQFNDKYTVFLGTSLDKNLIEMMLIFHIVQIVLTNPIESEPVKSVIAPDVEEAMDVDSLSISLVDTNEDVSMSAAPQTSTNDGSYAYHNPLDSIVNFCLDILKAAGHQVPTLEQIDPDQLLLMIKSNVLYFLRSTTIFVHFMTQINLPSRLTTRSKTVQTSAIPVAEEYNLLCDYLGITRNLANLMECQSLKQLALCWTRHSKISSYFIESCTQLNKQDLSCVSSCCSSGSSKSRDSVIKYVGERPFPPKKPPLQNVCFRPQQLSSSSTSTSLNHKLTHPSDLLKRFAHVRQPHTVNMLVTLPHDYSDLINDVAYFSCPNSKGEETRTPTMCLVCGEVLCSQNYCCQSRIRSNKLVGACTYHTKVCGFGTGLFLRIRDCKVMALTTQARGCYITSPYVDKYGETDSGLLRGDPLYLSETSYDNIFKLWFRHGLPERIVHALETSASLSSTAWDLM